MEDTTLPNDDINNTMPDWDEKDLRTLLEQYFEEVHRQREESPLGKVLENLAEERRQSEEIQRQYSPEQLEDIRQVALEMLTLKLKRRVNNKWTSMKREWENDPNR